MLKRDKQIGEVKNSKYKKLLFYEWKWVKIGSKVKAHWFLIARGLKKNLKIPDLKDRDYKIYLYTPCVLSILKDRD